MVSSNMEGLVSGVRLSTVVPAKVTGDNKAYELTNMDLAMKLHYIKGVYFFHSEAVQGLSIFDLKEPMFQCLEMNYTASGRIRRSETTTTTTGRPFIRCNDGGVRVVEANCDKTIDEWLQMEDRSLDYDFLTHNQVLGPDLGFSPLVFIQFTWFKCGGMSMGLSWAHVLGDVFSASSFINTWGKILAGHHQPQKSLQIPHKTEFPTAIPGNKSLLIAMKKIDPVGDHWLISNTCSMGTHSFQVTASQLDHILSNVHDPTHAFSHFEVISAMIWKSMSKIRADSGPNTVTICSNNSRSQERVHEIPTNSMVISSVEADFTAAKADVSELAMLIAEKKMNQNSIIEETLKEEEEDKNEKSDFIVYGANLTFVNLEGANVCELEIKGQRPVFVNYSINGVGDEGLVMVMKGPKEEAAIVVTLVLPENQIAELKCELKKEWGLA